MASPNHYLKNTIPYCRRGYVKNLIECVPNFSEGCSRPVIEAIVGAILSGPEVMVLNVHSDPDHNRSVVTFVATKDQVGLAALRGIGCAIKLINLQKHSGCHPRIGSADVVPFIPFNGTSLCDCIEIAQKVGDDAFREYGLPIYLYGAASRKKDRFKLENIRRGQFELLREKIKTDPTQFPDFGLKQLHPTAGATLVGARNFLIAFNVNLETQDVRIARQIAKNIRENNHEKHAGLPGIKAIGVKLGSKNLVQVSVNITDYKKTSIEKVFQSIKQESLRKGVKVRNSEIVGLIPKEAIPRDASKKLLINNFDESLVLENRLGEKLNFSLSS